MNDQIERMIKLLEDILRWQKFQGFITLKKVLLDNIKSEKEKQIYELSDGLGTKEIAKKVNVSHVTVYNYWQRWSKMGIVELSKKYKGRYERMVSLFDIGIDVPKIEVPKRIQPTTLKEDVVESIEKSDPSEVEMGNEEND